MNKNALFLFNIDSVLFSKWNKKESLDNFLIQNSVFFSGVKKGLLENDFNVTIYHRPNIFFGYKLLNYKYLNVIFNLIFGFINRHFTSIKLIKLIKKNKIDIVFSNPINFVDNTLFSYLEKQKIISIQWFGLFPNLIKFYNKIYLKNTPRYSITSYSGDINDLFPNIYKPKNFVKMFNPNIIKTFDEKIKKDIDILFIGGLQRKHSNRWEILEKLKLYFNENIHIYGYGKDEIPDHYQFKKDLKESIHGELYINTIRRSKIVINLFLNGYENFCGINNRIFEVLALKSFLITEYNAGINDFFEIGNEIISFKNIEELIKLIEYYLKNENEREMIQKRGYLRVKEYNYYNFIEQLVELSNK